MPEPEDAGRVLRGVACGHGVEPVPSKMPSVFITATFLKGQLTKAILLSAEQDF